MALPNFIHIGSAKAGSTYLWEVCKEHLGIYTHADSDNPNFFTTQYHKGLPFYEDTYFPTVADEKAVVEFSNSYLVHPPALTRVARHLPDVRLTVTVRNPIERCYRSWAGAHYQGRHGLDPDKGVGIPFDQLLHPNRTTYFRAWAVPGFYAQHLQTVYSLFPRERVLVMVFDDLESDPEGFLRRYFTFLGVDPEFKTSLIGVDINPDTDEAKSYRGMSDEMRSELGDIFREDLAELSQMLGRDLSHWQ